MTEQTVTAILRQYTNAINMLASSLCELAVNGRLSEESFDQLQKLQTEAFGDEIKEMQKAVTSMQKTAASKTARK